MNQREGIHETNWDVLFIIDACRYDYFKSVYRDVFKNGELLLLKSTSTFTMGWMIDNFENESQLNVTYVSPDFEINSKGIKDRKIYDRERRKKYKNIDFDCRKYFKEIIDVWYFGVDEKCGVVKPETIIKEVDKQLKKKKRVIGKFWQVHDPYLYYIEKVDFPTLKLANQMDRIITYKWVNLRRIIHKIFSEQTIWRVRCMVYRKSSGVGLFTFWRRYGRVGIERGYTEDLLRTLRCIKTLVDKYPKKKFVITSDHGEFLGEKGRYGHGVSCENHKVIQEVPWFTVRGKDGSN